MSLLCNSISPIINESINHCITSLNSSLIYLFFSRDINLLIFKHWNFFQMLFAYDWNISIKPWWTLWCCIKIRNRLFEWVLRYSHLLIFVLNYCHTHWFFQSLVSFRRELLSKVTFAEFVESWLLGFDISLRFYWRKSYFVVTECFMRRFSLRYCVN